MMYIKVIEALTWELPAIQMFSRESYVLGFAPSFRQRNLDISHPGTAYSYIKELLQNN